MSDFSRQYTSMGSPKFREGFPELLRQFPLWDPLPDPNFALIAKDKLEGHLQQAGPGVKEKIEEDIKYLEQELMPMFRDRDFKAKEEQNRYRKFQIYFMALAATATFVGSLQVIVIDKPSWVSFFAFLEMLVALLTTYIATIKGNESPLQRWLMHRRRAEALRREYFRFLANIEPYDQLNESQRRRALSIRAADINRGVYPQDAPLGG